MKEKTYGRGDHANKAGYQGSGGSVELTQGSLGAGKGSTVRSKAPIYDTYGEVLSVKTGHQEVGSKI